MSLMQSHRRKHIICNNDLKLLANHWDFYWFFAELHLLLAASYIRMQKPQRQTGEIPGDGPQEPETPNTKNQENEQSIECL